MVFGILDFKVFIGVLIFLSFVVEYGTGVGFFLRGELKIYLFLLLVGNFWIFFFIIKVLFSVYIILIVKVVIYFLNIKISLVLILLFKEMLVDFIFMFI